LVSFLKWVLALIITIILVPKIEPYVSNYINNEYVSGIGLGIGIYIVTLFILILTGKSLSRLFSYTGLGLVDKIFGFFFGIFKGYIFAVCIFSIINWFYSYEKWDMSLKNSYFFSITEKGSRLLINEFPSRKEIENTKEKIKEI
jgi:membrane protein required for colicin V production